MGLTTIGLGETPGAVLSEVERAWKLRDVREHRRLEGEALDDSYDSYASNCWIVKTWL